MLFLTCPIQEAGHLIPDTAAESSSAPTCCPLVFLLACVSLVFEDRDSEVSYQVYLDYKYSWLLPVSLDTCLSLICIYISGFEIFVHVHVSVRVHVCVCVDEIGQSNTAEVHPWLVC